MINRLYIEGNIRGFRGFAPRRGGGEEPTEKVPQMDKFTKTTRIIRI